MIPSLSFKSLSLIWTHVRNVGMKRAATSSQKLTLLLMGFYVVTCLGSVGNLKNFKLNIEKQEWENPKRPVIKYKKKKKKMEVYQSKEEKIN